MPRCLIKICGLTRESDVKMVGESGVDTIGLLIDMPSPRSLDAERAGKLMRLSPVQPVLLFFDKERDDVMGIIDRLWPTAIQLQGHESPEYVAWLRERTDISIWKGVHLPAAGTGTVDEAEVLGRINAYAEADTDIILLDTVVKAKDGERMGGTGKSFDWKAAAGIVAKSPKPVMLAGGLKPENVAKAIKTVRPFGVDLASGVESSPGIKDPEKVRAFVKAVEEASKEKE